MLARGELNSVCDLLLDHHLMCSSTRCQYATKIKHKTKKHKHNKLKFFTWFGNLNFYSMAQFQQYLHYPFSLLDTFWRQRNLLQVILSKHMHQIQRYNARKIKYNVNNNLHNEIFAYSLFGYFGMPLGGLEYSSTSLSKSPRIGYFKSPQIPLLQDCCWANLC